MNQNFLNQLEQRQSENLKHWSKPGAPKTFQDFYFWIGLHFWMVGIPISVLLSSLLWFFYQGEVFSVLKVILQIEL